MITRSLQIWIAVASLCAGNAIAQEVPGCGNLSNAFGPFDYRDPRAGNDLRLVERFHFTPEVAALQAGRSGTIAGDLDYMLRAFPNHHRALSSVARYSLAGNDSALAIRFHSSDCYFQRAIAFAPNDQVVRAIYANFLAKAKRLDDARKQYDAALELAPRSAEINYNAALFFLEVGDLARAKQLAEVAYTEGHPLPGLKQRLEALESP